MKKIAVFLLSLLMVSSLYGRDRQNEFGVSYSQFTVPQFVYVFGGVLGIAFSMGSFTLENMVLPGALSLEYTHYVNDTFGFGGTVTGEFMTADKYTGKDESKKYDGKFQMGFVSVMPHAKAYWFNNPHFGAGRHFRRAALSGLHGFRRRCHAWIPGVGIRHAGHRVARHQENVLGCEF